MVAAAQHLLELEAIPGLLILLGVEVEALMAAHLGLVVQRLAGGQTQAEVLV